MRMAERRMVLINKATSGGELPAGYRKCKYLEGDGYTAIQTNIIATRKTYVEADIQMVNNEMAMGSQVQYNQPGKYMFLMIVNDYIDIRFFNYNGQFGISSVDLNWLKDDFFHLTFNKENQGTSSWLQPILQFETENDIFSKRMYAGDTEQERPVYGFYLFTAGTYVPGWTGKCKYRVKTFKMVEYDTEEVLIDLIPCLDNNGRPCMYDKVSKQSFYNIWTAYADEHEFLYELEDE